MQKLVEGGGVQGKEMTYTNSLCMSFITCPSSTMNDEITKNHELEGESFCMFNIRAASQEGLGRELLVVDRFVDAELGMMRQA
jgi:hypothetical protein